MKHSCLLCPVSSCLMLNACHALSLSKRKHAPSVTYLNISNRGWCLIYVRTNPIVAYVTPQMPQISKTQWISLTAHHNLDHVVWLLHGDLSDRCLCQLEPIRRVASFLSRCSSLHRPYLTKHGLSGLREMRTASRDTEFSCCAVTIQNQTFSDSKQIEGKCLTFFNGYFA